jgi:hypothetical protein
MRHISPSLILVLVTVLLAGYGSTRLAWVFGPVTALGVWALGGLARRPARRARRPVRPTGVLSHRREPAPVD